MKLLFGEPKQTTHWDLVGLIETTKGVWNATSDDGNLNFKCGIATQPNKLINTIVYDERDKAENVRKPQKYWYVLAVMYTPLSRAIVEPKIGKCNKFWKFWNLSKNINVVWHRLNIGFRFFRVIRLIKFDKTQHMFTGCPIYHHTWVGKTDNPALVVWWLPPAMVNCVKCDWVQRCVALSHSRDPLLFGQSYIRWHLAINSQWKAFALGHEMS